jgi:tripartite-type tricarboxylate transporter receptor subunit TctC
MGRSSSLIASQVAVALALACAGMPAAAQGYPVKPIRVVVPFPPASGADILARAVGAKLTERSGQQVLVDSRPGASGVIAAEIVSKAPPDGYTLMLGTSSSHAINVSTRDKLPYDPLRDFSAVSLVARVPMLLMAHPSLPVRDARELIALAKARPGQLTYATAGNGTTAHLAGELLKSMARVDIVHVPYRGSPQALLDAIAGQVSLAMVPTLTGLPQAEAGKLKALAITTSAPSSSAPGVPTLAASGVPGYEATLWYGLFAPAGTPWEIVARLSAEVVAILGLPEVRDSLQKQGADPAGNSPDAFAAFVKAETAKWAKVVKSAGLRAN